MNTNMVSVGDALTKVQGRDVLLAEKATAQAAIHSIEAQLRSSRSRDPDWERRTKRALAANTATLEKLTTILGERLDQEREAKSKRLETCFMREALKQLSKQQFYKIYVEACKAADRTPEEDVGTAIKHL